MQILDSIQLLCKSAGLNFVAHTTIAQSGGDRQYYRVQCTEGNYIATYSDNLAENKTFFEWGNTFAQLHLPVPKVLAINAHQNIYLQQDLGQQCLLDLLLKEGYTSNVFALYQQVLTQLVRFQIEAHKSLNYDLCLAAPKFGYAAALFDVHYFKQYYLGNIAISYDEVILEREFELLADKIDAIALQGFMYRDLQGRNIMVHNTETYFIDYQGGMQGPPQYDVASLLYQAKAALPMQWKQDLFTYYTAQYSKACNVEVNQAQFTQDYNYIVLMRLLQVLGAYGRRGLLEGKAHFVASIPFGVANIKEFAKQQNLVNQFPTLSAIVDQL
jgi:RNase adapter protein RapZ